MKLSAEQQRAKDAFCKWFPRETHIKQYFLLLGPAGTGKTTVAQELVKEAGKVKYCAPTGRSASILSTKTGQPASTIHRLIYKFYTDIDGNPQFILNDDPYDWMGVDLIVVDEVSMVPDKVASDLLALGIPLLLLGDPFQLPPVNSADVFSMDDADFVLTEVHRQALDNPVIEIATSIRNGRGLIPGNYGNSSITLHKRDDLLPAWGAIEADMRLAGLVKTVSKFNDLAHRVMYSPETIVNEGEVVMTETNLDVKANWLGDEDDYIQVRNGSIWTSLTTLPRDDNRIVDMRLRNEEGEEVYITADVSSIYGEKRTYTRGIVGVNLAHAMTVHKAQGSEAPIVAVIDESRFVVPKEMVARHLYTAITRASQDIHILLPGRK